MVWLTKRDWREFGGVVHQGGRGERTENQSIFGSTANQPRELLSVINEIKELVPKPLPRKVLQYYRQETKGISSIEDCANLGDVCIRSLRTQDPEVAHVMQHLRTGAKRRQWHDDDTTGLRNALEVEFEMAEAIIQRARKATRGESALYLAIPDKGSGNNPTRILEEQEFMDVATLVWE